MPTTLNIGELIAFILYLAVVIGVGVWFFFKTKDHGETGYFLGGRQMGPWVAALSASASDMSAWLLMGLPGSILVYGVCKLWIPVGLLIGTILAWVLVAPRLRSFSIVSNDSITIPQYLSNRFLSKGKGLQVICAVVFLVCYAVYAASSFKACGTLFNTVFGMNPTSAIVLAAAVILVYTLLGGFNAVCWTDFFQGMLMLIALLLVPIIAVNALDLPAAISNAGMTDTYWNIWDGGKANWTGISTALSGLGWGLGYFGMPHILVRYMSIKSDDEVKKSRIIAIVWIAIALAASAAMALVGRLYLPELVTEGGQERIFIMMSRNLFPGLIAGILLSAILAASMSTADSQLLVAASAFASDIYKPVLNKKASDKQMMWMGRIAVAVLAVIALVIALNPNSGNIMALVENAWAGFGSAFGAVILLSLYWKRFTYKGAVAGIIAGAVTDVLWLLFLTGVTGIYEIIPGFIVSMIAAVIVTKLDKEPSEEVKALFDKAAKGV